MTATLRSLAHIRFMISIRGFLQVILSVFAILLDTKQSKSLQRSTKHFSDSTKGDFLQHLTSLQINLLMRTTGCRVFSERATEHI